MIVDIEEVVDIISIVDIVEVVDIVDDVEKKDIRVNLWCLHCIVSQLRSAWWVETEHADQLYLM